MSGIVTVCVCAASASAVTRKVPSEYPQIQAAIQASQDGDVVVVAPGVYYETINFGGRNIVVTGTDPNDPKVVGYTIINADDDGSAVTFENGETPAAVLTGFTLTGGFGTLNNDIEGGGNIFWGGGIYCLRASPTITKNIIAHNRGPVVLGATDADTRVCYGGGIACIESNAIVTHNVIRNNVSFVAGGFILYIGQATVSNNLVYDNSAYLGGGVILIGGDLINNTIVGNDCNQGPGDGVAGNAYIIFEPTLGNVRLVNNIICNAPSGGGLLMVGDWQGGVIACNDVWNNMPGNYVLLDQQTGATEFDGVYDQTGKNGNISVDPLFLNPFNKDYHLTLESPCINAGDPAYARAPGQVDIDGESRVYASRVDMGADEYVGYVKPVAFAGSDRHVLEPLQPVTLDGSGSFFYDPCEVTTFQWTQVSGPSAVLSGPDTATPAFTPEAYGEYVFQLVVGDDRYNSEPDEVLVLVAENQPPVADAGPDKVWKSPGQATLDGTGSWDPDVIDPLRCQWTQVEGPPVELQHADTSNPSFFVESEGQYVFELVVSDGFAQSGPSRVHCLAVGVTTTVEQIDVRPGQMPVTCYPDVSGTRIVYATGDGTYQWRVACKDMATGKVETFPGTGINVQPKIDGDLVVWSGGVSLTNNVGPETTSVFARHLATGVQQELRPRSGTASFDHPAVSNDKVVWVQHLGLDRNVPEKWYNPTYDICGADLRDFDNPAYFTIATGVGRHDLFSFSTPVDGGDVVDICGDLVVWEGDGDIYAADISDLEQIRVLAVCNHPARQYDPAISGRFVVWTDERNDRGDIYGADLSNLETIREFAVAKGPGVQEQPTIDGALVVYLDSGVLGGQLQLACMTYGRGVLNTELPDLYVGTMPVLDGATLVWLTGLYGPAQGARLGFGYSIPDGRVRNLRTGKRYDFIQHAVSDANDGDQVVADPDLYIEKINFAGKAVTVRSADPNDPDVVAATVLRNDGDIVTFTKREGAGSVLAGLTLDDGDQGIVCSDASPTVTRCTIRGSRQAGVRLLGASDPTLVHCRIVGGGAAGVEMSAPAGAGRVLKYCEPVLRNCIIEANRGQGIHGGKPTVANCTVVENLLEGIHAYSATVANSIVCRNNRDSGGAQMGGTRNTVTYSDIEGGWPGEGNIDADPLFIALGRWTDPTSAGRVVSLNGSVVWVSGDYHLKSRGWRWNALEGSWVSDEVTSPCIDAGDPASELLGEPLTAPGDPTGPVINTRINMGAYGGTVEASLAPLSQ
jgi:beta propeller repeat protein